MRTRVVLSFESLNRAILPLWIVLVSHRAFIPRTESISINNVEILDPYLFAEVTITVLVFASSCILALGRLRLGRPFIFTTTRFLLAFFGMAALATIFWSPNFLYSGFWLLRLSSAVILLLLYFERADEKACERFTAATIAGMLPYVVLPILAFFVGLSDFSNRTRAFWFHTGPASILAFSIGLFFITRLIQDRGHWLPNVTLAGVALASAFLAGGKTGAVGGGAAVILIFAIESRRLFRLRTLVILLVTVLGFWILQSLLEVGLVAHLKFYLEEIRFGSMTGRFNLWEAALLKWLDTPWSVIFGHGFASTRILGLSTPLGLGTWTTTHAHNSFLQTLLELGIVGTIPIIAMMLIVGNNAVRKRQTLAGSPLVPLAAAFSVLLVGSLTDDVFGSLLQPPFYLFLALTITMDQMLAGDKPSFESSRLLEAFSQRYSSIANATKKERDPLSGSNSPSLNDADRSATQTHVII